MKKIEHFISEKYISTNVKASTLVFNLVTGEKFSEIVTGNQNFTYEI